MNASPQSEMIDVYTFINVLFIKWNASKYYYGNKNGIGDGQFRTHLRVGVMLIIECLNVM